MNINETVLTILRDFSSLTTIQPEDSLQDDLGLDSLGLVSLLLALEDTFGIRLKESDMDPYDLQRVRDVISLVQKYTGERHA